MYVNERRLVRGDQSPVSTLPSQCMLMRTGRNDFSPSAAPSPKAGRFLGSAGLPTVFLCEAADGSFIRDQGQQEGQASSGLRVPYSAP